MKAVPATTLAAAAAASTFATACNSATHSQATTGGMFPGLRIGHSGPRTKTTTTANAISALLACPVTRLSENHLHSDGRLVVCSLPRGGGTGGQDENDEEASKETNDNSESLSSKEQLPKKKKKKKQQSPKDKDSEKQQHETEKRPKDGVGADMDSSASKHDSKKESNNNSSKATSHNYHNKNPSQNPTTSSTASARSNKIVEDILTHEDYYHVLGLDKASAKTTTQNEITKAYRKRAVQTHPDKTGGDRRAFDKVAEAYDVLSDETKKQLYDRYGKAGVAQGGGGGGGMPSSYQDMFRSMFQQQQEQQRQRQQPRNRTMRYQLQVTLEELYQGKTQTVQVTPPNQRMFRQQQQTAQPAKDIQVHIPKGSISGEAIVLSGEMDFIQDTTPGDLIFILSQVPHGTFTRKGHDLAMELVITLDEAICGVRRTIQHLDGRSIVIQSAYHDQHHPKNKPPTARGGDKSSGENKGKEEPRMSHGIPCFIQTGDVQVLKGQGMPKRHHRHSQHHPHDDEDGDKDDLTFGDLYVQYRVELPKVSPKTQLSLSEDERNELGRLLRKLQGTERLVHTAKSKNDDAENEVNYLQPASSGDFGRASGPVIIEEDHHRVDDADEENAFQNPFGSTFFQSANTNGGSGSFYFGSSSFGTNPFGGGSGGPGQEEDGSNVQCNQM